MSDRFQLPPYPHDKIKYIVSLAEANGMETVDLSIGTPCDLPSEKVIEALTTPGVVNGYPPAIGTAALREAARQMLRRRFEVDISEPELAMCVGTKEFVAGLAHLLHLRTPEKDTVLYPAVSYPTYAMGAYVAGLRAIAVPPDADGKMDLAGLSQNDLDRTLLLWINTPANPTGVIEDMPRIVAFAKSRGITVCSDECYGEFTEPERRQSILNYSKENVLALHSLSKRSNAAGLRVGFYAGDEQLVYFLKEIRKHLGFMIPGPIQAAGRVAFSEDDAVDRQWKIYQSRLAYLIEILESLGVKAVMPQGGFYLWVKSPAVYDEPRTSDDVNTGWLFAEDLAKYGGMLVSPGDFYGELGSSYVRIAAVQPQERLETIEKQFKKSTWTCER